MDAITASQDTTTEPTPPIASGPRFDLTVGDVTYVGASLPGLRARGIAEDVLLNLVKSRLKAGIDARAEALRSAITTPGSGQAMEYQEAQAQATAALKASASATPENYPMLAASVGIDIDPTTGAAATDVVGVARSIDQARTQWLAIGSAIRGARLAAKKAIDEATSEDAAAAAYEAAAWPALPSA